jgi:hypothetical protein
VDPADDRRWLAGQPIQIGATSTDESGLFVLPLPPSITLPAPAAEE